MAEMTRLVNEYQSAQDRYIAGLSNVRPDDLGQLKEINQWRRECDRLQLQIDEELIQQLVTHLGPAD